MIILGKRKKRASTSGGESVFLHNSVYVRKGAVVGVYFRTNETSMPVIGTVSSGSHSVCEYDGTYSTTSINCTSHIVGNLLVHVDAQIVKIECDGSDVSDIQNGQRSFPDGDKEYGARALYTCNEGYEITSGDEYLTCNENEEWSGTVPTCSKVNCGMISDPQNGNKNGNNFEYEGIVTFSCDTGYELNGTSSITCLSSGQWNDTVPTCELINCDDPGTPSMGQQNPNALYKFGSQVTFTCIEGYEVIGSKTITCQANGLWSEDIPHCSIIHCGTPETPANGFISNSTFAYKSSITFTCNDGYVLSGNSSAVCEANKSWSSDSPQCLKQCPNIVQNLSALIITPEKDIYVEGDILIFNCPENYVLNVSESIICNSNGIWNSSIPSCIMKSSTNFMAATSSVAETTTGITISTSIAIKSASLINTAGMDQNLQDSSPTIQSSSSAISVIGHSSVSLTIWSASTPFDLSPTIIGSNETDQLINNEIPLTVIGGSSVSVMIVTVLLITVLIVITMLFLKRRYRKRVINEQDIARIQATENIAYSFSLFNASEDMIAEDYNMEPNSLNDSNGYEYETVTTERVVTHAVVGDSIDSIQQSVYWEPGNSVQAIYAQLSRKKYKQIPRHEIKIIVHLGSGQLIWKC